MTEPLVVCAHCDDVAPIQFMDLPDNWQDIMSSRGKTYKKTDKITFRHKGKVCCFYCYQELLTGTLPPASMITDHPCDGGKVGNGDHSSSDVSPWQSNAIRHLEDG